MNTNLTQEEQEILLKIRELKNLRNSNSLYALTPGYEKNILFILDVLKEIAIEEPFGLLLFKENKKEIVNALKLGISRSRLKKHDGLLGGRKSRIDEIQKSIQRLGYKIFSEQGFRECLYLDRKYKKSTIYEALRKMNPIEQTIIMK